MDFEIPAEAEAFRKEVKHFLADELPAWWRGFYVEGDERIIPLVREICEKLASKGWLTMAWPQEFGGAEADIWKQMVLKEEMWIVGDPRGPQTMNLSYIGPILMRFGTEEQKQTFLPAMAQGKLLWCEGFSERGAGSDLASLQTIAEPMDDHLVVNGQKMWTSYASAPADYCLLLARTDPGAYKHKGISMMIVDMRSPGVTVQPIPSMVGPQEFNEVTFEDVIVPMNRVVGPLHQGWNMAMFGLAHERVGIARHAKIGEVVKRLVEHCRTTVVDGRPLSEKPEIRSRIAELYCRYQAARLLIYRSFEMQHSGQEATVEAAIAMIHATQGEQFAGTVGMEVLGPAGQIRLVDDRAPIGGYMERQWRVEIGATMAGGTTEVQKAIIAQRGLGLPKSY